MAVSIFLANSPPLHSFLGGYDNPLLRRVGPLRPCLSNVQLVTRNPAASAEILGQPAWKKRKKKRVVFADARGLALTVVHVFNEAEDTLLSELQFHMTELEGAASQLRLVPNQGAEDGGSHLLLDFVQPAADYLDMRNRLKSQQVCLETCSIQDRMLSGTVQVRNLSFEKSVWVRITFDSWRSHQDVAGVYLNNVYGCPDIDTFSFSVVIPDALGPSSLVEFCIQYQAGDQAFWDNNRGENYRLVAADTRGRSAPNAGTTPPLKIQEHRTGRKEDGIEFDPFGSPRTSAGIFPEWQSWGPIGDSAPYW
uniref:Protein phosphatase 1 regulatory subunit n=1 Tax=Tetraodon nigroviridis TaxID=99883 RepID=H3CA24_TETNG